MDLMAINLGRKLGGGSADSYTKAETDALLDGKADLVGGKVPAAELPSYVDDTIEGYYYEGAFYEDSEHTTAITGEAGKIYIDLAANKSYRWTGAVYVRIDECPAFGETQGTIYEGNKGKANADAIAAIKDGQTIDSFGDVETALADKVDKVSGKGLSTEDYTTAEQTKLAGIEAGAEVNVQSDWNQTDDTADDFIKNKPNLAAVATSGSYTDLTNKPTLGTVASHNVASAIGDTTDIPTAAQVSTALAGKQATLTTAQQAAADSGVTAAKVAQYDSDSEIVANLAAGLVLVAHQASTTSSTLISLSYTASTSDFSESSSTPARYTGTYLVHCVNWGTTGQPYIGLLTYSGNDPTKLTKTDIVTGFAPTITLTDGQIDISGCARISIYAMR